MKNLKKVLSLALAFAMVLGLCIGASAAQDVTTLKDWDEVENKSAATLLNAFSIMQGHTDGTFAPNDNVTRAQAAKMISVALWGGKDDKALYAAGNIGNYTDVTAGEWYMGYVNYMSAVEVMAGKGEGKFDPEGNVTGYELLKMCLVALGYDAKTEGLVGAGWDIKTMALATKRTEKNLTDGATVTDWSAPLSRMNAATIIANMIWRNTVSYSDGKIVAGNAFATDVLGMTPRTGTIQANEYGMVSDFNKFIDTEAKGYNNENTVIEIEATKKADGSSNNDGFTANVEMTSTAADVGAKVTAYVVGKNIVSATVVAGTEVTPKFAADGKIENLDKAILNDEDTEHTLTVSINGKTANGEGTEYAESDLNTIYGVINKIMIVKNDAEVKFFDTNDDGYIDTVKAYKYTVNGVTKDDGKTAQGAEQYKLSETGDVLKSACDFEAKKGDFVAVATMPTGNVFKSDAASYHGYVLKTVEGKVTRASSDRTTLYIDGVKYTNAKVGLDINAEGTFHLFANGTIADFTGKQGETVATTYAVIYGGKATPIEGGTLTAGTAKTYDTKVAAILEDGTVGEYTLAAVKISYEYTTNETGEGDSEVKGTATATIDATKADVISGEGNATVTLPTDAKADAEAPTIANKQLENVGSNKNYLVKYTLDGNKITIIDPIAIGDGDAKLAASAFDGKVTVGTQTITSKTVGFVQTAADGADEKWTVVKGTDLAKKVDNTKTSENITYVAGNLFGTTASDGKAVAYMAIQNAALDTKGEGTSADLYYVLSDPETFKEGNDTMWAAKVFNGSTNKVEEMTWKATAAGAAKGDMFTKFESTGFDEGSKVTGTEKGFVAGVVDTLLNVVDGSGTQVSGAPFTVTDKTKYYLIDGDNSKVITLTDLAKQDPKADANGKTFWQVEVKTAESVATMVIVYAAPQSANASGR